MPVNPPQEYYIAEQKYLSARSVEEKIACLEEMIRLMPKHHGSETALAQLKSRLAKLKRDSAKKKPGRKAGIAKEGEAQVCLMGFTNSGKSFLLKKLTGAKPEIAEHPYTTIKPEVGMMDYNGIKIQIVELPSTFQPEFMSIARTADAIALLCRDEEEKNELLNILKSNFIRSPVIAVDALRESLDSIKTEIWRVLGLIIVYTKAGKKLSPMALPIKSTVKDFAMRIHKDFIKNFRFARLLRTISGSQQIRNMQVGLDYTLQDGDIVELHTK
ncbi:MAG: TGS domain-containing protein [Candidatus Aenigmarchaeota archaeon]|nr:TGS domain-containing protein [Candidatus Aenigmarchaeota archaeon]